MAGLPSESVQPLFGSIDACARAAAAAFVEEFGLDAIEADVENLGRDSGRGLFSIASVQLHEEILSLWRNIDWRINGYVNALDLNKDPCDDAETKDDQDQTRSAVISASKSQVADLARVLRQIEKEEDKAQVYQELMLNHADAESALVSIYEAEELFERNPFGDVQMDALNFTGSPRRRRKRFGDRFRKDSQLEFVAFQEKLKHVMRSQREAIHLSLRKGIIEACLRALRDPASGVTVSGDGDVTLIAKRVFQIGDSSISVFAGSITDSNADIVVSSDDSLLTMGGGVSQAIQQAAGVEIIRDAAKMVPRAMGDVVVTTAGQMRNRYVAHAITMKVSGNVPDLPRGLMVRQLCQKVMALLPELGCRSVAFPALGAGVAAIPYQQVAAEMAEALLDAVLLADEGVHVQLYLRETNDGSGVATFLTAVERVALERFGLAALPADTGSTVINLTPFVVQGTANAEAADRRQHEVMETLRDLDAQRSRIEAQILELTSDESGSLASGVRALTIRLDALAEIRHIYESALNRVSLTATPADGSVFVSSTSKDLREHRTAVRNVVDRLQLKFVGMEDFEANALAPAELIRSKVMASGIYLGILGMRYGYVDDASGLSMTELEYRQAIASDKDIRMFVMDDDAPITASMVERDPAQLQQLNEFRKRVLTSHSCNLFQTPVDLAEKVERTLSDAI